MQVSILTLGPQISDVTSFLQQDTAIVILKSNYSHLGKEVKTNIVTVMNTKIGSSEEG